MYPSVIPPTIENIFLSINNIAGLNLNFKENVMIVLAINLIILAFGIFAVGMYKPNWILFWMDNPGRIPILFICTALFMSGAVIFGEHKLKRKDLEVSEVPTASAVQQEAAEIPAPTPEMPVSAPES
jgi:hypothetical protein